MKILKFIKLFEAFNYDEYLKKYGKEFADAMMNTSWAKQNIVNKKITLENITKEDIKNIINDTVFDEDTIKYGDDNESIIDEIYNNILNIRKLSNPIYLYRIVAVDDISKIDINNIGTHFVFYKWMINSDLIQSAGIDDDKDLYVITVSVNKYDIDLEFTIKTNYAYDTENEITLNKNSKPTIINIESYDNFK